MGCLGYPEPEMLNMRDWTPILRPGAVNLTAGMWRWGPGPARQMFTNPVRSGMKQR